MAVQTKGRNQRHDRHNQLPQVDPEDCSRCYFRGHLWSPLALVLDRRFGEWRFDAVRSSGLFYLVKIEPRSCRISSRPRRSLRAPSSSGEEDVLAHWTVSGLRVIASGVGRRAASFSIGVRPRSAMETRSWLYRCSHARSAS